MLAVDDFWKGTSQFFSRDMVPEEHMLHQIVPHHRHTGNTTLTQQASGGECGYEEIGKELEAEVGGSRK